MEFASIARKTGQERQVKRDFRASFRSSELNELLHNDEEYALTFFETICLINQLKDQKTISLTNKIIAHIF